MIRVRVDYCHSTIYRSPPEWAPYVWNEVAVMKTLKNPFAIHRIMNIATVIK